MKSNTDAPLSAKYTISLYELRRAHAEIEALKEKIADMEGEIEALGLLVEDYQLQERGGH